MMCFMENCPHKPHKCKLMHSLDVIANGFNVVLDKKYPTVCHVLQFAHGDIVMTDNFSDEYLGGSCVYDVVGGSCVYDVVEVDGAGKIIDFRINRDGE